MSVSWRAQTINKKQQINEVNEVNKVKIKIKAQK